MIGLGSDKKWTYTAHRAVEHRYATFLCSWDVEIYIYDSLVGQLTTTNTSTVAIVLISAASSLGQQGHRCFNFIEDMPSLLALTSTSTRMHITHCYKCTYRPTHECTNAQMHKRTNAKMHKCTDGQVDIGHIDRQSRSLIATTALTHTALTVRQAHNMKKSSNAMVPPKPYQI